MPVAESRRWAAAASGVCNDGRVVGAETVSEFVAEHLPSLRDRELRQLAVGDFATWLIDETLIVRLAFNAEGDRQLQREAAALVVIRPRLNLSVPDIAVFAPSAIGHLAVAYPLLPGVSGEEHRPEGSSLSAAADTIATCLRHLHEIDPTLIDAELPEWTDDYHARLEAVVDLADVVRRHAPDDISPIMERYLDGTVEIPSATADTALCHTDLKGEHFLLNADTKTITGIIDWADIAVDDPAVDIGSLAIWLGEDFVRSVATRYGSPPELVERGLFRIRTWILTGYARMLAGENSWPPELVKRQVAWAFRS